MKIIILLLYSGTVYADLASFNKSKRAKLLEDEATLSIGGSIELDDNETTMNNKMMQWKFQEADYAFNNAKHFNFSHRYIEYKVVIKSSKVYQFIRAMPKGAALHVHASGLLGPDYLLNITYKNHLYVCFEEETKFKFAQITPSDDCNAQWILIRDVRRTLKNVTKFDSELRKNFTLIDNEYKQSDVNSAWKRFADIFQLIYPLVSFRPVWEEYLYDALKEFRKDNVMYVEIRSGFPELYELDGTIHHPLFFGRFSKSVVEEFVRNYPDFLGAKLIFYLHRHVGPKSVAEALALTKKMKKLLPDFIAGFDLVGQEDLGGPLVEFLPQMSSTKNLDYFFHAGETAL